MKRKGASSKPRQTAGGWLGNRKRTKVIARHTEEDRKETKKKMGDRERTGDPISNWSARKERPSAKKKGELGRG